MLAVAVAECWESDTERGGRTVRCRPADPPIQLCLHDVSTWNDFITNHNCNNLQAIKVLQSFCYTKQAIRWSCCLKLTVFWLQVLERRREAKLTRLSRSVWASSPLATPTLITRKCRRWRPEPAGKHSAAGETHLELFVSLFQSVYPIQSSNPILYGQMGTHRLIWSTQCTACIFHYVFLFIFFVCGDFSVWVSA